MRLSFGIFDELTVTTYTLPWILGSAYERAIPNVELKAMFFDNGVFTVGAQVGVMYVSAEPENPLEAGFEGWLVPSAVNASVRFHPDWTWSVRGAYGFTAVSAGTPPDNRDVNGFVAVSAIQVYSTIEARQSEIFSLTLTGRFAPYVPPSPFNGDLSFDELTSVRVDGDVSYGALDLAAAFEVAAHLSWESFNLKLGLGYGAFFVPNSGLVAPGTFPVPVLDIFWRF